MKRLLPERLKSNSLLREWTGPLTEALALKPGGFGLGQVPASREPTSVVDTVCGYCATGCSLKGHLREGAAVNLSGTLDYPVNLGMACPKGWEALRVLEAPDRADQPLLRGADGRLSPVSWDVALRTFCERFKTAQRNSGPDSLAWLGTGQATLEDLAFLGALAKFGMGIRHGDGNTRQCMATAVAAYKESFGFDAPPYTYQDLEESDTLVFIGANPCIAHPILWQRVMRNPHRPEIVVVDPRKTETAIAATQHYAIAPKSDLVLLYGIARLLIEQDHIDKVFIDRSVEGYECFKAFAQPYTVEIVSQATGLGKSQIRRLAATIAAGNRVSFWWTMGVNQSHEGVRVAQAIINLALITGNIGRPGTGANSITGQCNAMGSRLFSNTTCLLGGHDFADPSHRSKVARHLGIDEARIPTESGWAYDQIVEGIERGVVKCLWIVATNSAHSWIGQSRFREAIRKLDFLVVQDMYRTTDTALEADLILPAAGWGEREGTYINSERRIGRTRKLRRPPGQALADFSIFRLVAQYWGCGAHFEDWDSPASAFRILAGLTEGRPCDISGIRDYEQLEREGGIQWPFPSEGADEAQQRRLFEDGRFFRPNGRAKLVFEASRPVGEPVDDRYSLILLTGRGSSSQWHTQTRTAKSPILRKLYPQNAYVEISPSDAAAIGARNGSRLALRSRRASVEAVAFVTPTVQPGQVFMPMHYKETNWLTRPDFDPISRQPSYKHCAVTVELAEPKA